MSTNYNRNYKYITTIVRNFKGWGGEGEASRRGWFLPTPLPLHAGVYKNIIAVNIITDMYKR